jgi:putative SOS response-associated peptidase YedK
VPAEWFYEWAQVDSKTKQPYGIGLKDGSMFAFADLWDRWTDKATGQKLETHTVITTEPNEVTAPIHNRMPVILAPKAYERWLTSADPARPPVDLLRPYDALERSANRENQSRHRVRRGRSPEFQPTW